MKKINSYIKFVESKGTNVIIKIYTQEEFGKILQNEYKKTLDLDETPNYISKIENRIRHFSGEDLYNIYKTGKSKSDYYIVLYDDNYIIGIAKLGSSPYVENRYWISFISVDEQYRSNGYSKILIEEIFKLAKEKNLTIEGSYQTDMGKERIGDYINKVADKYNVLYVPHERDVVKEAMNFNTKEIIAYHGTISYLPFRKFDMKMIGKGIVSTGNDYHGFFFTTEKDNADFYTEYFIIKVKIHNVKNNSTDSKHPPTVLKEANINRENYLIEDILDGHIISDIIVVPKTNLNDIEILEWEFVGDEETLFEKYDSFFGGDNNDISQDIIKEVLDIIELDLKYLLKIPVFNKYFKSKKTNEAIGYRSGDLVNKAECLYRMNSNRGTGHFGSGFYFFGNKEEADKYDSREVTSVDFDDYNMFNVKSYQSGIDLHEALKEFNNGIIDYIIPHQTVKAIDVNKCVDELDESENNEYNYFDIRYTIKDILSIIKEADDISEIIKSDFEIYLIDFEDKKLAQDCFDKIVEKYKELYQSVYDATKLKMLNNLKKAFVENGYDISDSDFNIIWDKYLETISDKINKKTEEYKGLPTASTRIMKILGFEGVNVIGIEGLDNSAIGSVIYDIKQK